MRGAFVFSTVSEEVVLRGLERYPAPTWLLTTICGSVSKGVQRPLLASIGTAYMWCTDIHLGKKKHAHKIKTDLKKK